MGEHILLEVIATNKYLEMFIVRLKDSSVCAECSTYIPGDCVTYRFRALQVLSSEWHDICALCIQRKGVSNVVKGAHSKHPCSEDSPCYSWHLTGSIR